MTKIEIKDWLKDSAAVLNGHSDFPFMESQVLLSFVTGQPREWLISHPESSLSEEQVTQLNSSRDRLLKGEPLPYLVGKQAFFGLDFLVTRDVLIPRPETELLVEEAIQWLEDHPSRRKIIDIGTGSGIIAITLADHFQDADITAVDISATALALAERNAELHRVKDRIQFRLNDLLTGNPCQYDLILANLPYIPTQILDQLPVSRFEPRLALDGGKEGLDLIGRLLDQSVKKIHPSGLILLEIETDQSEACLKMTREYFSNCEVSVLLDLAKHPRILKIQL
ncbi:MAG: peptide chain release factor N(5)-glutamine methyltransferase [Chloroflexi bacterium]|nr:peptide chain release factor N(5)-glutamine methyltransferase [Chloroflexota bacterium]